MNSTVNRSSGHGQLINRSITILLLACLIVPFSAGFMYLHYKKGLVKREVKQKIIEGIDRQDLVLFKIAKEKINILLDWEHDHEFKYKGHMYDVVSKETTGNFVFLWCWPDEKESKLNRQMYNLIAKKQANDSKDKRHATLLFDLLKSMYLNENQIVINSFETIERATFIHSSDYLSLTFTPPVPPPELG